MITGIILAGGKSSRMGRDKALLPFGGKTLLEDMAQRMSGIFDETLVIVDERAKTEGLDLGAAQVHEDLVKYQGPLSGIYTGLCDSKNRASFVWPCDMPLIDEWAIHQLIRKWKTEFSGLEDLSPEVICFEDAEGRAQPFPGVYRRSARTLIRLLLDQGQASMNRFFEVVTVRSFPLDQEKAEVLTNLNTPEDYEKILRSQP